MILDEKKEKPVVFVQRVLGISSLNILELVEPCPFCGEIHEHGARGSNDFGSGDGYREADCFKGEYYIKEVNNSVRREFEKKLDEFGYIYKKVEDLGET